MSAATNYDDMISARLGHLDTDLVEAARLKSPKLSIQTVMHYIGTTFRCDRIYLFSKNAIGHYDCTEEWCREGIYGKKHLMQNLDPKVVRSYYNYFLRDSKLMIRNMEEFKQEDYALYRMLSAQNLSSVMCAQLLYDGTDLGFVGIDNPDPERFDELSAVFEVITYFVAVQLHRQTVFERVRRESRSISSGRSAGDNSLFQRMGKLVFEQPITIVNYHLMRWNRTRQSQNADLDAEIIDASARILSGIYGIDNVYMIGKNEFLILLETSRTTEVDHQIRLSRKALQEMGLFVSVGMVAEERYEDNLFDLINIANANMLEERHRYQDRILSKYHLDDKVVKFLDLVVIYPISGEYHIIFSAYGYGASEVGNVNDMMERLLHVIYEADRPRFIQFWNRDRILNAFRKGDGEYSEEASFLIYTDRGGVVRITLTLVAYTDVDGEPIILCYSE